LSDAIKLLGADPEGISPFTPFEGGETLTNASSNISCRRKENSDAEIDINYGSSFDQYPKSVPFAPLDPSESFDLDSLIGTNQE
jgi:hypothetical protein